MTLAETKRTLLRMNMDILQEKAVKEPHSKIGSLGFAVLNSFLLVEGPCGLLGQQQWLDHLETTEKRGSNISPEIRIKIWKRGCSVKPRTCKIAEDFTEPFQGVGVEKGLQIFFDGKQRHPHMHVGGEVMKASHVFDLQNVLTFGWGGMRTSQDTLAEIGKVAASLQDPMPILVKNGAQDFEEHVNRVIAVLSQARKSNGTRCGTLKTVAIPTLRGIPLHEENRKTEEKFLRSRENWGWVERWEEMCPGIVTAACVSHLSPIKDSNSPELFQHTTKAFKNAVNAGARAVMVETTTGQKNDRSLTDPGIPIQAFYDWLIDELTKGTLVLPKEGV